MIELIDELEVANELGEGIIWDAHSQRALWVDIDGRQLFRYDPITSELESWETPEKISCVAPVSYLGKHQDFLIAAFESGFAYYQPETGRVEWLNKVETDNPGTRLNDGRTDRQGRFWAGTMVTDTKLATYKGKLYCVDTDLTISSSIENLHITNSLCWSPDSKYLYHCDTPSRQIDRYNFNAKSGAISNHSKFVKTQANCYPDGSIVDADGHLWNAQWGGSQLIRYNPDGEIDLTLQLPVSQPTCVAFGGKNLNILFVTSARQDLSQEQLAQKPSAGNLLIFETDYIGMAESPFTPNTQPLLKRQI